MMTFSRFGIGTCRSISAVEAAAAFRWFSQSSVEAAEALNGGKRIDVTDSEPGVNAGEGRSVYRLHSAKSVDSVYEMKMTTLRTCKLMSGSMISSTMQRFFSTQGNGQSPEDLSGAAKEEYMAYLVASQTVVIMVEDFVREFATSQAAGNVEQARAVLKGEIFQALSHFARERAEQTLTPFSEPSQDMVDDALRMLVDDFRRRALNMEAKRRSLRMFLMDLQKRKFDPTIGIMTETPFPDLERQSILIRSLHLPKQKIGIWVDASYYGEGGKILGVTSYGVYYTDNYGLPLRLLLGSNPQNLQKNADPHGIRAAIHDARIRFPLGKFVVISDNLPAVTAIQGRMQRIIKRGKVRKDIYSYIAKELLKSDSSIEYTHRDNIPHFSNSWSRGCKVWGSL